MADAICKHCGHVHKKLVGDRGFSVLHALEKISECCPDPFYIWAEEGSLYHKIVLAGQIEEQNPKGGLNEKEVL